MKHVDEYYGFGGRPDATGIRKGLNRPLSVRSGDFPYDKDLDYGEPAAYDRADSGHGGSHHTLTPKDTEHTTWDDLDEQTRDEFVASRAESTDSESEPVGEYEFQGLPIVIENPIGSIRKWQDHNSGESGWNLMWNDYGYINGAIGKDGEDVDVYVGPDEESEWVFVVHQMKKPDFTEYDEDKVMLGFKDEASAKDAYLRQYDDPGFFGGMSTMGVDDFKAKLNRVDGEKITNESVWEALAEVYGVPINFTMSNKGLGGGETLPGSTGQWSGRVSRPWDDSDGDLDRMMDPDDNAEDEGPRADGMSIIKKMLGLESAWIPAKKIVES